MSSTPTRITHLINGLPWEGTAERTSPVFNPATGEQTGELDLASADLVDEVVTTAHEAWASGWGDISLAERTQVLFRVPRAARRPQRRARRDHHGRARQGARATRWARSPAGSRSSSSRAASPHLLKGDFSESVSTKVDVYSIRQPLGVVAVISPFNFPAMVPCWFFPIAIACGNAVVLKPSEKDPSAANWLAELWAEAGLPAGVFNVVHGDKVAVDRAARAPRRAGGVVRRLHADRALRLRDRHRARQAGAGARRREEPHGRAARRRPRPRGRRRGERRASARPGERCMAISAVVAVGADRRRARRRRSPSASRRSRSATAPRLPTWARWSPRSTATRSPSYLDAGVEAGRRRSSSTDASTSSTATDRRVLARPDALRPRHAGDDALHRRDLRPGAVGACASTATTTRSRS